MKSLSKESQMVIKETAMGLANHAEVTAALDKASVLLKRGWTTGASARAARLSRFNNGQLEVVAATSDDAACFCLSGALTRAVYDSPDVMYGPVFNVVEQAIFRATRRQYSIAEYNDTVAKSVDDVTRIIDSAKAIAQEGNLN